MEIKVDFFHIDIHSMIVEISSISYSYLIRINDTK